MRFLWYMMLLFPVAVFVGAGISEVRSAKGVSSKLLTVAPCVLGIVILALSWGLKIPFPLASNGRFMALCSASVACAGLFGKYSWKGSRILIALAGLQLALLYLFFNEPVV